MIRLKELRLQRNLNMAETAKALDIKYTTYVDYEKGNSEPNAVNLVKLAKFYDVSADYILGRTDDPRTQAQKQQEEDELAAYLEMLRTRPEMRILLDTVAGATKEEVEANVHFLEALRGKK